MWHCPGAQYQIYSNDGPLVPTGPAPGGPALESYKYIKISWDFLFPNRFTLMLNFRYTVIPSSLIQTKCQGGNKYALPITVKFDQSTRRFGRISFARLFKLTKHYHIVILSLVTIFTVVYERFKKCQKDGWIDDLRFYVLFNSVSVISGR